jgi:hypothetical protein
VGGSFWVRNDGNAPLTFVGQPSAAPSAQAFQLVNDAGQLPFTLDPGGEREVMCTLLTSQFSGAVTGDVLQLHSDDPFRPIVELKGTGRAAGPHLTHPGEATVNVTSGTATLGFLSDGTSDVRVSVVRFTGDSKGFEATGTPVIPGLIPPGTALTVTVTALNPGQEAQLYIEHDGTGSASQEFKFNLAS